MVGFLIVWWLGAKGFCTHGCPYGAFFATADRILAPVRIKVTNACDACGHCTHVCTSNVRVHEEVAKHGRIVDPGCMKCLDCVSVCPKDALYVGLAMPKPFTKSQQRVAARADFTWPEELVLAIVALVSTQWVWRAAWFGDGVPFLMAVGLGAITAVASVLLLRLLFRRAVTFQHMELKRSGGWTRSGRWALVLLVGWLALAGHTGVAKWRLESALEAAREPVRVAFYDPRLVDVVTLQKVVEALDRYRSWAFLDDPRVPELRALALRGLGKHVEAEKALLESAEGREALLFDEASLALASYCMDPARRRYDDAERLVNHVLKNQPDHPIGRMLRQQLASRLR
ncbi:MAG: hypothetical protein JNK15_22610 [Planctomycetes bacterium]|nr:hypothetical protein [Planctomycetota bacterium]